MNSLDEGRAGDILDEQIAKLQLGSIVSIQFDDDTESIEFLFSNQSVLTVSVDNVGLVNLHNHIEEKTVFFDASQGQFMVEKSPVSR